MLDSLGWIRGAVALVAAAALAGCADERPPAAPPRPTLPSPPARPAATRVTADFGPLFAPEFRSSSVYLSRDAELMKRILLGPNLVLEASRSSLVEPKISGPPGAPHVNAPDLADAAGAAVDIHLSSLLLSYLGRKGSTLLATVISRRWSSEWWCVKDACQSTTWVERALMMHQARAATKDMSRIDAAPTAALAVRRLGRVSHSVEVVAEQTGEVLTYRFRRAATDTSLCPAMTFEIPALVFSAEIVSLHDGRILARIDETMRVADPAQTQVPIEAIVPVENAEAVSALRTYADAIQRGAWVGAPPTQPYWLQSDMRCKNAEEAFRRIAADLASRTDVELPTAAGRLFHKTLEPLYERPLEPEKPVKKGRGAGR